MLKYYVLDDDHNPVPATPHEWAKSMYDGDSRRVALTRLPNGTEVSTVFLGMDHNFGGGPPHLFETMLFKKGHGCDEVRTSTWAEAEQAHQEMVDAVGLR